MARSPLLPIGADQSSASACGQRLPAAMRQCSMPRTPRGAADRAIKLVDRFADRWGMIVAAVALSILGSQWMIRRIAERTDRPRTSKHLAVEGRPGDKS